VHGIDIALSATIGQIHGAEWRFHGQEQRARLNGIVERYIAAAIPDVT